MAGVVVIAAILVVVGRHERSNWVRAQLQGMNRVQRLVGPLGGPSLSGFRVLPQFDCLVYRRGPNPFALELCVDGAGRLIQAIDRTGSVRRYYDLQAEPSAATIRVNRTTVDRLLQRMGAPKSPSG